MDIGELEIGMEVCVWDYAADGEDMPEHWNSDMADFMGSVVVIAEVSRKYDEVWIEEDEGQWVWKANDFDPFCPIPKDNPNVKFKTKKEHDRIQAYRKKALKDRKKREEQAAIDRMLGRGL